MTQYFITDAECDGLDGPYLSIAAGVYDSVWQRQDVFYGAVAGVRCQDSWAAEHVQPHLSRAREQFSSENALLQAFWAFWKKYPQALVVADVPCPVESRLFARCLALAGLPPTSGPCPILDLSSMLYARGIDPATPRDALLGEPCLEHDALSDVETTVRIMEKLNLGDPHQIISYHTFIFPFLWDNGGKVKAKKFARCLNEHWKPDTLYQDNPDDRRKTEYYCQYQYFNQAARNAMYTDPHLADGSQVVINYRFDLKSFTKQDPGSHPDATNPIRYRMIKDADGKHWDYSLGVNGIRLKLFNTGVGMVIFELENYWYSTWEDICRINEFGRRVYLPYYALSDEGRVQCAICADWICLQWGENSKGGTLTGSQPGDPEQAVLIEPLNFLLCNGKYKTTTSRKTDKNEFYIEPVIDDRMFVACYYKNTAFVETMAQWVTAQEGKEGEYRYLADTQRCRPCDEDNAARMLYEMMFVDGTGSSCQSRTMLRELLEKHVYGRWVEYYYNRQFFSGTITGITEYSMISVTSNGAPDHLANAFLSQYLECLILALAQRASLLAFERQISDCALEKRLDVQKVQKRYILFQSQLLLQEVTPQQQGIELYDMLLENLYVNKEKAEIEAQIMNLFSQKDAESDKRQNMLLNGLAILGLAEAMDILSTWFSGNSEMLLPHWKLWVSGIIAVLLLVVLVCNFFDWHPIRRVKAIFFHAWHKCRK